MHQHRNVSKSVSQHGMQTVNETLGMSNQTNSCHTLPHCRCSKTSDWTCQKQTYSASTSKESQAAVIKTHANVHVFGWHDEQQHPWSCLKTVALDTVGFLVARKHLIWFFILLIIAGSAAHPHCFSLSAPRGFYIYVCQEGEHLCACRSFYGSDSAVLLAGCFDH